MSGDGDDGIVMIDMFHCWLNDAASDSGQTFQLPDRYPHSMQTPQGAVSFWLIHRRYLICERIALFPILRVQVDIAHGPCMR